MPIYVSFVLALFFSFEAPLLNAGDPPSKAKLVVQIVVDQLRGDLLTRYHSRFGNGGFRYLLEQGVIYSNAQYQHANTETVVGHTVQATGAFPAQNGMVANLWIDRATGKTVYNVADSRYPILMSTGKGVQKDNASIGRSPATILTTTFSDELAVTSAGAAKIFSVSSKDRGAIPLAGHAGKAFWYSSELNGFDPSTYGHFVTSSFYFNEYPAWVVQWNKMKLAEKYRGKYWNLLKPRQGYYFANEPPYQEIPCKTSSFPHSYDEYGPQNYYDGLLLAPAGDELVLDFVMTLIEKEELGKDNVTDYLGVSFSCTDYVGHRYSPASLEGEDIILHLDKSLTTLFAFIDKKVGLDNTLIVLSADHGAPEPPEFMTRLGLEVGRLSPERDGRMLSRLLN